MTAGPVSRSNPAPADVTVTPRARNRGARLFVDDDAAQDPRTRRQRRTRIAWRGLDRRLEKREEEDN